MKKSKQKPAKKVNDLLQASLQYQREGNLQQAEYLLRETLKTQPFHTDAYHSLGNVLQDMGKTDEAITCYLKAIELSPDFVGAYYNLAALFHGKGQLDEAITYYQKALQLNPNYAGTYNSLGAVFQKKKCFDEAIHYYQKALQLEPNFAFTYNNLGMIFQEKGHFDEAVQHFQKALELDPYYANAYVYLGRVLRHRGEVDKAEACFRRALEIKPDSPLCYTNLLFLMLYHSRYDTQTIFSEHIQFARHCAEPLYSSIRPHINEKNPQRKLKIGYVSPDFRDHSVAYFFEPVLISHSREHFEIFCYSDVECPDEVTERIQRYTDHWQSIAGISDEETCELIRRDGIDILIDLAGHTSKRLLLFARKPAPIQVNWIGYPATTGLSTMDYKIVDHYTDPPGMTEEFYTENLIRMPESFLCYLPNKEIPEPGPLPALLAGHITFGSFNNFSKISPGVFDLWSRILKKIPGSCLILKAESLSDRTVRHYALDMFTKQDISLERITLLPWEPSTKDHLNLYSKVDIGLDTFPYNGTTTTCEALWMGVPVITLAGNTHASRVGVSLLTNASLAEFIAKSPEQYLGIAIGLSQDLNRLQSLRTRLRDIMSRSPLMDTGKFVTNLENCYQTMWEKWCKTA